MSPLPRREGLGKSLEIVPEPRVGALHFASLCVDPPHESHAVVEEQVALGLATADEQHSILVGLVLTAEPLVIYVIEDIDVVDEDGLVVAEQRSGLLESATRVEQLL